jgi:fructokinase
VLAVIGEALIDLVDSGEGALFRAMRSGSPLNVAVGAARLGQAVHIVARFSRDAFGRELRRYAEENGVATDRAVDADEPSAIAAVHLDADGKAIYDFYLNGAADWQWTDNQLSRLAADADIVHTGSIASWFEPGGAVIRGFLERARAAGQAFISVDPNVRPALIGDSASARELVEPLVKAAHLVKASDDDVAYLWPKQDPLQVARQWAELGPELVVLTRGSDGCQTVTRDGRVLDRPGRRIAVADTVGAGDAFMACLLADLTGRGLARPGALAAADDEVLSEMLDRANLAAALTCGRIGADPPTAAELAAAG